MSAAPPADPAIGLGQIQAADPSFNLEIFKREAAETFVSVKSAIASQDLTPVVDLLAESVYDDLRLVVMGLEARGAVQHYDGLSPASIVVAAANRGPEGDAITLQIRAVAMLYLGSAGHDEGPSGDLGTFTEFWTFTRPPSATSDVTRRNECPICGAPIDIDTGRICRFCNTLLPNRQTQTGWIVAAIRPAQENL